MIKGASMAGMYTIEFYTIGTARYNFFYMKVRKDSSPIRINPRTRTAIKRPPSISRGARSPTYA
jgi:hypothetical protein